MLLEMFQLVLLGNFNQPLLNFNQYFPSDADYIFFARSLDGQLHLSSPITFAMHTITLGTLTAGMVKNNFEEAIKIFVASDNAFSFIR